MKNTAQKIQAYYNAWNHFVYETMEDMLQRIIKEINYYNQIIAPTGDILSKVAQYVDDMDGWISFKRFDEFDGDMYLLEKQKVMQQLYDYYNAWNHFDGETFEDMIKRIHCGFYTFGYEAKMQELEELMPYPEDDKELDEWELEVLEEIEEQQKEATETYEENIGGGKTIMEMIGDIVDDEDNIDGWVYETYFDKIIKYDMLKYQEQQDREEKEDEELLKNKELQPV